jgi:hypothetical protein
MHPIKDMTKTMELLTRSTAKYVYRRIGVDRSKDREAYKIGILSCISVFEEGFHNLEMIKTKVNALKDESRFLFPKNLFNNRTSEIKYYNVALNQVIEIIRSIEVRFITGGSDEQLRGRSYITLLDKDEGIF